MTAQEKQLSEVLEGRFIRRVLTAQAHDIDIAQVKYMSGHGFTNPDWLTGRDFNTSENALDYSQKLKHRFVDMKTRESRKGKQRKKAHPIHNRIIWGHYNNIVRELAYGFTEAVKEELRTLE